MIECVDTLGSRLVEGDLIVARIKSSTSIAKILPESSYNASISTAYRVADLPYINVAAFGLSRRWVTKKGGTFRHPYFQYYPNTKAYQKYGQYVYKFQINKCTLYKSEFIVKLPEHLDFMEFAKKHYHAMRSLNAEGRTLQTSHDLVELLMSSIDDLKKL